MNMADWLDADDLAKVTAEELDVATARLGIRTMGCWPDDDGRRMNIAFNSIRDAETLVSLGVVAEHRPGSLYDRTSAACVSLATYADSTDGPPEGEVERLMEDCWHWTVHPDMVGRRMDWHVSVDMLAVDAQQLVINLNQVHRAGGGS